jgi:hypothetical protein
MNTKSIAGIVGLGLLLCSCVTTVAAECGFGALCNKSIRMLLFPVRVCYNGSCSNYGGPSPSVSSAYFVSDGTVLTQLSVSRSCYGAGCQPDDVDEVLKSVHMI